MRVFHLKVVIPPQLRLERAGLRYESDRSLLSYFCAHDHQAQAIQRTRALYTEALQPACIESAREADITARRKLYARYSHDAYLVPAGPAENVIDKEFLQKPADYIDHNLLNTQLNVESIAELFHGSRSQVYRKIKAPGKQ